MIDTELELEFEAELAELNEELEELLEGELFEGEVWTADEFWPTVLRVFQVGRQDGRPIFRTVGRRLKPKAARAAARRGLGVFLRGTRTQARSFARKVGGQVVGPERHGDGLPHFHVLLPGDRRIHVWFGRRVPKGDFFSA